MEELLYNLADALSEMEGKILKDNDSRLGLNTCFNSIQIYTWINLNWIETGV